MDPVADSIESLDRPYLHGSSASSLLRFTFGKDDPATQLADHLKFIRLYKVWRDLFDLFLILNNKFNS